ncbi:MAG: tyrosine-type recombinase/integrase [Chloroflexi bacterium]|nr:tyrosine-type recombinase/integrase [Chloroflexota bacterium]
MKISLAVDGWVTDLKYRRRSPRTLQSYQDHIGRAIRDWGDPDLGAVSPGQIRAWLSELPVGDATRHGYFRVLRAFWFWVAQEWDLPNTMLKVKSPAMPKVVKEKLTAEDESKLLKACGRDLEGVRNKAIVCLLLDTGIRAQELIDLQLQDVHPKDGWLLIRKGKGGKGRQVPISARASKELWRWIGKRESRDQALFTTVREPKKALAFQGLRAVLDRLEEATGVKCNPHKFRHTFATKYAGRGNLFSLQKILGHTSLEMVRRYADLNFDQVDEDYRRVMG